MSGRAKTKSATSTPSKKPQLRKVADTSASKSATRVRITTSTSRAEEESINESGSRLNYSALHYSREDEKEELAFLNTRLASYIDYVRSLETVREQLTRRVTSFSTQQENEVKKIKDMYEDELRALRSALDAAMKDKAQLQMRTNVAETESKQARDHALKLERELNDLRNRIDKLQSELHSAKNRGDLYLKLLPDYEQLKKQYEATKRQLEQESLLRTDAENRVQTAQEDLEFRERIHRQEISQLRQQQISLEEEITTEKGAEYELKLAEELQRMREATVADIEVYRDQMEENFQSKLQKMQDVSASNYDELARMRMEVSDLTTRCRLAESERDRLEARISDLQETLNAERDNHKREMDESSREVMRLRRELEEKLAEFADLMTLKISLDQEILIYRKLLDVEENRCNLKAPERSPSPKRRRVDMDAESEEVDSDLDAWHEGNRKYEVSSRGKGLISINVEDFDTMKCVALTCEEGKEAVIGGWRLQVTSAATENASEDDTSVLTYKIPGKLSLQGGEKCTIYGMDSTEVTHSPPHTLVMRDVAFQVAPYVSLKVFDQDDVEQDCLIINKFEEEKKIRRRRRTNLAGSSPSNFLKRRRYPSGSSSLYSEQANGEKCSIM